MAVVTDDLFTQYVEEHSAEAEKKSNNSFNRTYEDIKWVGCEKGIPTIVRAVGGPAALAKEDLNKPYVDNYTARSVIIAEVLDDEKRRMQIIRPLDDEDYLLNMIIKRVNAVQWGQNKEKTFPIKEEFPEIYEIINKNGLKRDDPQYNYSKGWIGSKVVIMNVIDRKDMEWHKDNKHTKLLAKEIREYKAKDGSTRESVDKGISTYAVENDFKKLWSRYKSWEKYDISFKRTGSMNQPYIIDNATRTPEVVDEYESYVSLVDHLTEEEASWERYDISKLFAPTTYHKIANRLSKTINRIDATLGTNYMEILEARVKQEKELFDKLYPREDNAVEEVASAPIPRVREAVSTTSSSEGIGSEMPYYYELSNKHKALILACRKSSMTKLGYDITWDKSVSNNLYLCTNPECETMTPGDVCVCPACGEKLAEVGEDLPF